jgi:hypothetical protein
VCLSKASQIELNKRRADREASQSPLSRKRSLESDGDDDESGLVNEPPEKLGRKQGRLRNSSVLSVLPQVPANLKLDTAQVAHKVKAILKAEYINHNLFAKEVLLTSQNELARMVYNPTAWSECSTTKKAFYYKMHEWCQSPDKIQSLVDLDRSQLKKRSLNLVNLGSLPEVPSDLELDTRQVADTVRAVMKAERITTISLAKHVASIDTTTFSKILYRTIPWSECTVLKKKQYLRIHQWSQSPDEIKATKA